MKNLILTMGILLLMITGMIYDQDCRNLIDTERRLRWVCEEAAYGAAVKLWREGKSMQEAEAAAEEILQRNLGDGNEGRRCGNSGGSGRSRFPSAFSAGAGSGRTKGII